MSFRVGLVLVVAALAVMARVARSTDHPIYYGLGGSYGFDQGLISDSMDHLDQDMEPESGRRQLGQGGYISYGALSKNKVPCNNRGQSYYNCRDHQAANPYTRGCTKVTSCDRSTR